MRLIDADALSVRVVDASYWDNQDEDVIWNLVQDAPTIDAVPVEKYNKLKDRYERMKEIADILDAALRQYQRQYGE